MSGPMVCLVLVAFGLLGVVPGCAGPNGAARAEQPEPSYQTPPLPEWSAPPAEPSSMDAALLEGEVVEEQPTLDEPPDLAGPGPPQIPQKPVEPEKNVDVVPEPGQNSSTAPAGHGTVAPPQSD